jgi:hypothetical protein
MADRGMEKSEPSLTSSAKGEKIEFPWQNTDAPGYGERLQRMTSKYLDDYKRWVYVGSCDEPRA